MGREAWAIGWLTCVTQSTTDNVGVRITECSPSSKLARASPCRSRVPGQDTAEHPTPPNSAVPEDTKHPRQQCCLQGLPSSALTLATLGTPPTFPGIQAPPPPRDKHYGKVCLPVPQQRSESMEEAIQARPGQHSHTVWTEALA